MIKQQIFEVMIFNTKMRPNYSGKYRVDLINIFSFKFHIFHAIAHDLDKYPHTSPQMQCEPTK